jgi:uncharacterized membrane protein YidH (DUF202 family)
MSLNEIALEDKGTVLATKRTDLALHRTMFASDRTLMAWIRTALSMIGFGFSIYKFFQYLPEEIATGNIQRPQAPRNLGLTLIALGTLGLAAAAWQHLNFLREMDIWEADYKVPFAGGCVGCHFDWMHRFLRCATPPWSVLGENGSWSDT